MSSSGRGFDFWASYSVVDPKAVELLARTKGDFSIVQNLDAKLSLLTMTNAFQYEDHGKKRDLREKGRKCHREIVTKRSGRNSVSLRQTHDVSYLFR